MNIYVGNLSYNIGENDLKTLFEGFGEVKSAKVINDKFTGKSKGFGFVEMGTKEAAEQAIAELNGKQHDGRTLRVNEAQPPQPRSSYNNNRGSRNDNRY